MERRYRVFYVPLVNAEGAPASEKPTVFDQGSSHSSQVSAEEVARDVFQSGGVDAAGVYLVTYRDGVQVVALIGFRRSLYGLALPVPADQEEAACAVLHKAALPPW